MSFFTSAREKRLWLYALSVLAAILTTLVIGRPLQRLLMDQNMQFAFFLLSMILTGATIIMHGLKVRPSKTEMVICVGLAAVYIKINFRLGAAERSHLIEYGVLAIFIHKALIERLSNKNKLLRQALIAFALTTLIGVFDEGVQMFLPSRVFDLRDMLFNSLAAFMAIGGSMFLQWARNKFRKNK